MHIHRTALALRRRRVDGVDFLNMLVAIDPSELITSCRSLSALRPRMTITFHSNKVVGSFPSKGIEIDQRNSQGFVANYFVA